MLQTQHLYKSTLLFKIIFNIKFVSYVLFAIGN